MSHHFRKPSKENYKSRSSKSKSSSRNYYQDHYGKEKHPSKRSNVTKKKYTKAGVDKLRTLIELQNKGNSQKYYSIKVDGEVVVPKTNNPDRFDDFTQFVDQGTESVEIHLFHGHSNNCNKHILYFSEMEKGLEGVSPQEVNEIVQKALESERKIMHLENLQQRVSELEEENESLQELVEELQSKTDISSLGELAKEGLKVWMSAKANSVQSLGAVPEQVEKTEVKIEPEDSEDTKELSEQSQAKEALEKMVNQYDAQSIYKLMYWVEKMLCTPEMQKDVTKLFKKYLKRKTSKGTPTGKNTPNGEVDQ